MRWIAILMALALMMAGCADEGDGDAMPEDGGTNELPPADNTTLDEPEPEPEFESYMETWDGSTPNEACVGQDSGGSCASDPSTEVDSTEAFVIPEGASMAAFEFTWEEGGEIEVRVSGPPIGDPAVEQTGASPLTFTAPLASSGEIHVSVAHVVAGDGFTGVKSNVNFHMEMTVS